MLFDAPFGQRPLLARRPVGAGRPRRAVPACVASVALVAAVLSCPCHLLVYTPGAALAGPAWPAAGAVFVLALLALLAFWWAAHCLAVRVPTVYAGLGLSAEDALAWVGSAEAEQRAGPAPVSRRFTTAPRGGTYRANRER